MLADRIRQARGTLSRDKLGAAIGVTGHTIYRWERGEMRPRGDVIHRLAEHLGYTVEWFYQDEPSSGGDETAPTGTDGA